MSLLPFNHSSPAPHRLTSADSGDVKPGKPLQADGSGLSEEAVELGRAMEDFKTKKRKRFPTWADVLGVVKQLGYRKVVDGKDETQAA